MVLSREERPREDEIGTIQVILEMEFAAKATHPLDSRSRPGVDEEEDELDGS